MSIRRRNGRQDTGSPAVGIDDWTGFKVPLFSLRKEWDNLYTQDPDRRNEQDFVRGVPDRQNLPFSRPEAPDRFVAQTIDLQSGDAIDTQDGQDLYDQGVFVSIG